MKRVVLPAIGIAAIVLAGVLVWLAFNMGTTGSGAPANGAAGAAQAGAVQAGAADATVVMPTIAPAKLNAEGVPEELGPYALQGTVKGADALNEFASLHTGTLDLVNGYRASYAAGTKKATLWVGQAKDAASAQALVKSMADKIGAGGTPFQDLQTLPIGDRTIYSVTGQGQDHYFFATNDKVVWLAIDGADAPGALHTLWTIP